MELFNFVMDTALAALPRLDGKSKKENTLKCVFVLAEIYPETLGRMLALFKIPGAISGNLCCINMFSLVYVTLKSLLADKLHHFPGAKGQKPLQGRAEWAHLFLHCAGQSC